MNEPFGRGIVAGILGVIAINIVEAILKFLTISETALWEAGGIVFLSEKALEITKGIAIGIFSHFFVALVLGVFISYYIFFSGTNLAVIKSVGISLIAMFITLGLIFPLREIAVEMQDSPSDVLSAIIDHIVFGIIAGYIIKYLQIKNIPKDQSDNKNKYLYIPKEAKRVLHHKKRKKFIKPIKI